MSNETARRVTSRRWMAGEGVAQREGTGRVVPKVPAKAWVPLKNQVKPLRGARKRRELCSRLTGIEQNVQLPVDHSRVCRERVDRKP